jgi:RNA polymerase sigma-70 factor, ECF subfamily
MPDPRIQRAASGDRDAAQSLLLELLPIVRNLVRYLTRGDADVDDITQQVLIELLRSFGTYRAEGSLKSWASRIAVRVTLRRQKAARVEREQRDDASADLATLSSRALLLAEYLTRRQLVQWLDAIPSEQREALILHHVVGMSIPELAEELAVPVETVRSRLRLALTKLREREKKLGGRP